MTDAKSEMQLTGFRLGDWVVEPSRNRLTRNGESVAVEKKTMDTLAFLAQRDGQVVSADDIIEAVWGGRPMGENPVYKAVANLRKVLGDNKESPRYIETIARRGYRLIARVEPASTMTAAPTAKAASAIRWKVLSVVAIVLLMLAFGLLQLGQRAPLTPDPTVAAADRALIILPFENLSGDAGIDQFCRGLAEDLLNHLAELPSIRILARHSSFAFDEKIEALDDFMARVGAHYVLTGSVRQQGDVFRVAARLIDVDGTLVWSDVYERDGDRVLTVENDIAAAVAAGLELHVTEPFRVRHSSGNSFQAYTAYALGKEYLHRRPDNWPELAIEAFSEAMRLDPEFAPAAAGLATARLLSLDVDPDEAQELHGLILRSLELDPYLADGHAALGLLKSGPAMSADYEAAIPHLNRALEINPSHIHARNWLSIALEMVGRADEAGSVLRSAIEIDPLNPLLRLNLGAHYLKRGRVDLARIEMAGVLELPDAPGWAWSWLAGVEILEGRYDTALDRLRHGLANGEFGDSESRWEAAQIARVFVGLGLFDEANRWVAESRYPDDSPWRLAAAYHVLAPQPDRGRFEKDIDQFVSLRGSADSWPLWPRLIVGSFAARTGQHQRAIEMLAELFESGIPRYSGPGGGEEILDFAHFLALAFRESGQPERAERLLGEILEWQTAARRAKARLTGQDLAREAATYALLGQTDLGITRMRAAIDAGWRDYYAAVTNPCYATLFERDELAAAFESVRADLALQRERALAAEPLVPPWGWSDAAVK